MKRAQEKIRRILKLIDVLAPCRQFYRLDDIHSMLADEIGLSCNRRTVQRDLELLAELGMIEVANADYRSFAYRLNLRQSERLQEAAFFMAPGNN